MENIRMRKNIPGKPSSRMQFTKRNRRKRKQRLTPQKPLSSTGWATPGPAQASLKNSYCKHSTPFVSSRALSVSPSLPNPKSRRGAAPLLLRLEERRSNDDFSVSPCLVSWPLIRALLNNFSTTVECFFFMLHADLHNHCKNPPGYTDFNLQLSMCLHTHRNSRNCVVKAIPF